MNDCSLCRKTEPFAWGLWQPGICGLPIHTVSSGHCQVPKCPQWGMVGIIIPKRKGLRKSGRLTVEEQNFGDSSFLPSQKNTVSQHVFFGCNIEVVTLTFAFSLPLPMEGSASHPVNWNLSWASAEGVWIWVQRLPVWMLQLRSPSSLQQLQGN